MEQQPPSSFFRFIRSSEKPVLVDFYADWCGPCSLVSPIIRRIALEKRDQLFTININIDKKPEIARRYEVTSIPTIILFKGGEAMMRLKGAYPYAEIMEELMKHL